MKKNRTIIRSDRANAFVMEPETHEGPVPDDLAEYMGENFLSSATGGQDNSDEVLHNDIDIDELGGPFIETDAGIELASSDEAETQVPAEREAFPTALRSDRIEPIVRHRH